MFRIVWCNVIYRQRERPKLTPLLLLETVMIGATALVADKDSSEPSPNDPQAEPSGPALLSDEPTMELVIRARKGDRMATEALLERCLPQLQRWAHGRLPA